MGRRKVTDYERLAKEHATFLCEEIFKPAFIMGFVHGAKHAKADTKKPADRNIDEKAMRRYPDEKAKP